MTLTACVCVCGIGRGSIVCVLIVYCGIIIVWPHCEAQAGCVVLIIDPMTHWCVCVCIIVVCEMWLVIVLVALAVLWEKLCCVIDLAVVTLLCEEIIVIPDDV